MTVYLDNKTAEPIIVRRETFTYGLLFIEYGKNAPWYIDSDLGWITRKVLKKHFTYVGRL